MKFLINGAGLIGLLTAQALKSRNIAFEILDRDESAHARDDEGWAITLHWALDTFKYLIPKDLVDQLYQAQVRPDFHKHDTGTFKYINASTGETIVSIPPSSRLRVRREQVRKILMTGIDINWGCKVTSLVFSREGCVNVTCANNKTFTGDIILGCDGSNSITRRFICPEDGELYQLPVRFCGAKVDLTGEEMRMISENFDPLLFQGTVPSTETFFWFSFLEFPEFSKKIDTYRAQVNLSWRIPKYEEPFSTKEEKAQAMLLHGEGMNEDLSWLLKRVHSDNKVSEIKLRDWPKAEWDTKGNRVLLMGDAAHAMTMYRGEAANHGITDVDDLMKYLDLYLKESISWAEVISSYCKDIKERTSQAVLMSRRACLDAHDMSQIKPDSSSPLLVMRKKI